MFFLQFSQRLVDGYAELFGQEEREGFSTASNFTAKWGWFNSLYAIANGDITRLRQILTNLVSNAVKFTDQGEIYIAVTSKKLEHRKYEIQFAVKDTGIGIPPDKMDRLFKSFSQVDSSVSRSYGGTGLGLVISKRLAELMNGSMWVESELDKGATFYFNIVTEAISSDPKFYLYESLPIFFFKSGD